MIQSQGDKDTEREAGVEEGQGGEKRGGEGEAEGRGSEGGSEGGEEGGGRRERECVWGRTRRRERGRGKRGGGPRPQRTPPGSAIGSRGKSRPHLGAPSALGPRLPAPNPASLVAGVAQTPLFIGPPPSPPRPSPGVPGGGRYLLADDPGGGGPPPAPPDPNHSPLGPPGPLGGPPPLGPPPSPPQGPPAPFVL